MTVRRIALLALGSLCVPSSYAAPEPQDGRVLPGASPTAITGVVFDFGSRRTFAQGSDNWPTTWSDDDNQYAMWGDGGGFGGSNSDGRSSLGVARITGDNANYKGTNRYGGKAGECPATISGKSHGAPLSIGGVLYAWITPGSGTSGYDSFSLFKSADKACTWAPVGVTFARTTDGVLFGSFVQFGRDNRSAIDAYVYSVATAAVSDTSSLDLVQRPGRVMLLRAPAAAIENRSAYEFFTGFDTAGQPTWSIDPTRAVPVYQDANGVGPFAEMSYVPDLGLFVYTNQHGNGSDSGGTRSLLTMADAPRPWGPWTEFYRDLFYPAQTDHTLFQWNFAPKWFRNGGRGFTFIFTGTGPNDAWNTVDGMFTTSAVSVDLSSVGNIYALVNDGTKVTGGGLDKWGNAYSETLTGTSVSWSGATFKLGPSGTANGVTSRRIPVAPGKYASALLLATGVNGGQSTQGFVVSYSDGTSSNVSVQGLSDWYAPRSQKYVGESVVGTYARRVSPSGAAQSGPFNLYGYRLALDTSKTVQSITLPNNRNVVVVALDLTPVSASPAAVSVDLSSSGNVYALVNDGTRVAGGGMDGWGDAYSETLTGTSINWSGVIFRLGPSGTANGVAKSSVPLPSGRYASVLLLGTGVSGKQPNQTFVVTYGDGSATNLTPQSFSDWYAPSAQNYLGEFIVATYAHRVTASGAIQVKSFNLYGYKLAIDSSKSLKGITLPNNRNVVVVAIDLLPGVGATSER